MKFTDLFIRRPVLAGVISLLIVVLGLRSLFSLPVNQYPKTQNSVVTISTTYYGADAATVAGFITQPLESAIAQAQGIDYLSSSSAAGVSTITATLRLNYDANRALTEINTQVNSVKNQLPAQAQAPVLTVATGQTTDAMYMGFYSKDLPTNNVTDFLLRAVKPKLDSITGVQTAELLGARQFALRAWLDADKMAAHGLSAADVSQALTANNYLAALGATKGQMVTRAADRGHRPALARRVQAADRQAERRLRRAAGGRRQRHAGLRELRLQRRVRRRALGVHRHQGGARGQHPRRRQARARGLPRPAEPAAHRRDRPDRLRLDRLHQHLHQGSGQDAGRGAGDRGRGDLPVPGHFPRGARAAGGDAAVAGRRVLHHADAGLLDQPAHAARRWCWRSAWWSTTPSSWWRTSTAT